jgi:hypothetical protein
MHRNYMMDTFTNKRSKVFKHKFNKTLAYSEIADALQYGERTVQKVVTEFETGEPLNATRPLIPPGRSFSTLTLSQMVFGRLWMKRTLLDVL